MSGSLMVDKGHRLYHTGGTSHHGHVINGTTVVTMMMKMTAYNSYYHKV